MSKMVKPYYIYILNFVGNNRLWKLQLQISYTKCYNIYLHEQLHVMLLYIK